MLRASQKLRQFKDFEFTFNRKETSLEYQFFRKVVACKFQLTREIPNNLTPLSNESPALCIMFQLRRFNNEGSEKLINENRRKLNFLITVDMIRWRNFRISLIMSENLFLISAEEIIEDFHYQQFALFFSGFRLCFQILKLPEDKGTVCKLSNLSNCLCRNIVFKPYKKQEIN